MELLHSKKLASGADGASTQKFVDVEEIKDGAIVLKNGSLRAILMVSSINFDLKSSEEQEAVVAQYQNVVNSLDFPIQIIISSRKLNIDPYLDYLKEKEKGQANELLRFQVSEYRNFIKNLTEVSNIMSKMFYVVVPFYPTENKEGGFFSRFFSGSKNQAQAKKELFETYKNQLWQRLDHIAAGLGGLGIKAIPLKTEEIIELMFNSYNPSMYTTAIIKDTDKLELK